MSSNIDIIYSKERILESGLATASEIKGCSEAEIAELEAKWQITLPGCYRDFLSLMGREAGQLLCGTDWTYPSLDEVKEVALLIAPGTSKRDLSNRLLFPFASHQGYQFLYFWLNEGDNPPVWHYLEGGANAKEVSPSFSKWLMDCIEDEIADFNC